jgi:serine/threonine-protein kinase
MPLRAGTLVGDYQIVKKLGEGGMGEVYLAVHRTLGQRVVLKGLHREYLEDPELSRRLSREAEAMARLAHPNIVAIYNFIESREGAFIVMEYVEGVTFDHLIERMGLIPPARAIELSLPVLRALQYAHEHGVIHRDLKPANLMLDFQGHVRVLDFGTAKLVDRPGLTRIGTTLGTATYMAPEQVLCREVGPAADVYAFGVTLYEMCTGRLPFESENTAKLVSMIVKEAPVPPSVYYPPLPKALEDAILRCLAKDPAQRFRSAAELAEALEAVAATLGGRAAGPAGPAGTSAAVSISSAAKKAAPSRAAAGARPNGRKRVLAAIAATAGAGGGVLGVAAALAIVSLGHVAAGVAIGVAAGLIWAAGTAVLAAIVVSDILRELRPYEPAAAPAPPAPALLPPLPAPGPTASEIGRRMLWRHAPFDPRLLAPEAAAAAPPFPPAASSGDEGKKTVVASQEEIEQALKKLPKAG